MEEQNIIMQQEAYQAGAGGAVNSVNGQTGDVVLTTSDIENTSNYQTGSEVESAISQAVGAEVTARQAADNNLQTQIDAITASSDVTDIVGTYAELENYDTSTLGDNDIIKVLQDESQNDETTYYRWSTATESFTLIGEEGPYYTKSAVDGLLNAKQDTLTTGANVQIQNNVISATDTTYSDFTGTDGTAAGVAGLVPAPATTDAGKFLKADGTWDTAGSAVSVVQTTGTSTTDVMSQKAVTDMVFYGNNTSRIRIGSTSVIGVSSVVIGPSASTNAINSQGDVAIGLGAGTTSDGSVAIGQAAKAGPASYNYNSTAIAIGNHATASGSGSIALGGGFGSTTMATASGGNSIAIGSPATASGTRSMALGNAASATQANSVAIGSNATTTWAGEVNIGAGGSGRGYNGSNYRLLTGVYDGQSAHDAATVAQGNTLATSAPTASTVGVLGQLYTDTTNMHTYQCTAIDSTTEPVVYTWTQRW